MKNFKHSRKIIALLFVAIISSCKNDDTADNGTETIKNSFVENYTNIVAANYNDSYTTAVIMKSKIDAFLTTPTSSSLEEAKQSWLYARDYYGQTEAFREANGPIDNDDLLATEGQINAWPLDEGYIDYVSNGSGSIIRGGLINDTAFDLTEAAIIAKNEEGKDDNIATGWHAIEFLLWGQDLNEGGDYTNSGNRPVTDYTSELNATRRKQYLQIVTDLLVNDLKDLKDTWANGGSYRATFETLDEAVALKNILNGIGFISNGEVAAERLDPAIDEGQENEHSCFSDNTKQDMWANVHGIHNVISGKYTMENGSVVSGVSLIELTAKVDGTVATALTTAANNTLAKLDALLAIDKNFDEIISEESLGSNGPAGQLSQALKTQGGAIAEAAAALDVTISIE
ncbi:imelysin family protein [Wenyingzhuangia sp. IMCC45574]